MFMGSSLYPDPETSGSGFVRSKGISSGASDTAVKAEVRLEGIVVKKGVMGMEANWILSIFVLKITSNLCRSVIPKFSIF